MNLVLIFSIVMIGYGTDFEVFINWSESNSTKEGHMKKILAVNIDTINLNIISSLLTEQTPDFEILTTKKIGEIDEIIKRLTTNIIIIDLEKPNPQDLKILGYLSKSYPKLPLIVMTAFETGEIESAIKSLGTIRYFEKPVDFKEIADLIYSEIERGVGGEIHGISLTSFLQMSEMEKTSCTLRIKAGEKTGFLYLLKGTLIAAETDDLKNEEAVFEILSWEKPVIEINNAAANQKKEIQAPLISLLMESVRRKDEQKKDEKVGPEEAAGRRGAAKTAFVPSAKKIKEIKAALAEAEKEAPRPEAAPLKIEEVKASDKITDASKALKRRKLVSQTTRVLAAVLIILILGCLWQYAINPWLGKRKFNKVIADVTSAKAIKEKISILDKYLASGPQARYAAQAETMKESYGSQKEAQAFDRAIQTVSELPLDDNFQEAAKATYLEFLEQFPDGSFKDEINKRIKDIPAMMDDAEYNGLRDIPENHYSQRLKAYQSYLSKYPDSVNTANVKAMMNSLGQAFCEHIKTEKANCDMNKNWQRCITLCQYFLDNFKGHEQIDTISLLKREMTAQIAYVKIAEKVEKAGPLSEAAGKILEDYLKEHPDSPVRETVENQLTLISRQLNQEKGWQELTDYVKNDRNSIFDRVDRMRSYLNQRPPEKHIKEAEDIYVWLIKEKEKTMQQLNQKAEIEKRKKEKEALIQEEKKRIINQTKQCGGRYSVTREDTVTDNLTGLTWCVIDSSFLSDGCMDYDAAKKYVKGLDTGGYRDWRLPDPSELLVLYNSDQGFPAGNAIWYWTSEVFSAAWQKKVNTVVRTNTGIWEKSETDLKKCGAVRAVRP